MKNNSDTLRKILIIFLVAWGGLALAGSLLWPMGFDQGTYTWVGDVILRGGVPYRNAWEVKGPATYYLYALCQWIFGHHPYGIRVFDAILLLSSMACLWWLLAKRIASRWAGLSALLFIFYYLKNGYWNTATSDGYGMMLLLIAMPLVEGRGSVSLAQVAAAGGLVGLAMMFKITFAPLLLPLVLLLVFRPEETYWRRIASLVVFILAAGLMMAAWIQYLRIRGGWNAFVEINVFLKDLYRIQFQRSIAGHLFALVWNLSIVGVLIILGAISVWARWHRDRLFILCSLVWMAVGVATIIYQNKYYKYQFLIILPPLAWGAGPGLLSIQAWCRTRQRGPWVFRGIMLLVLAQTLPPLNVPALLSLAREHKLSAWYYDSFACSFASQTYMSYETSRHVAEYIRTHSNPEDTLQVWGWNNLLYTLGERACATRFGHIHPLIQPVSHIKPSLMIDGYRAIFLVELRRSMPKFILVADNDRHSLMKTTSKALLGQLENRPILEFITRYYTRRQNMSNYEIWERKMPLSINQTSIPLYDQHP